MQYMKMLVLILPMLAGCFVAGEDSSYPQESSSSGQATVVVTPEAEEVDYVVYREYFGCSDDEIAYFPHYRRYYGLTDDDIYFIYFTSLQCSVTFDVCFHSFYYDCDRNYDRLVVYYRVPRERYFVSIGVGVSPPPIYVRTYSSYRSGTTASVTFTNQEYTALVHMKVGCDYQGTPPTTYFSRVQATGSSRRVIIENREQSGHGGRTARGTPVAATAPRPWALPPQQKQQWHQEHQAKITNTETTFKERHAEQVRKVEKPHEAPPPAHRGPEQKSPPAAQPPQPRPQPQGPVDRDRPPRGEGPDRQEQPRRVENPPPKRPQRDPEEKPREGEKPRGDERGERQEPRRVENPPPPKRPQRDPEERPRESEKPRGDEKGERRDKDEKRDK